MDKENLQAKNSSSNSRKWKRKVLVILLLIIGSTQVLNHSGFCYREMRYLSERELVDRFLFGEKANTLTEEQKIAKIDESGGEYPNCCRMRGQFFKGFEGFINNVFGNYIYQVETDFPEIPKRQGREGYVSRNASMNACGGGRGLDEYSSSDNEENYEFNLRMIKEHWEGKRP